MESNITQETSTTEWDFRSFRLNCFHISYLIQIMLVWCSIGACNLSAWRGELLFMYLVAASFSECLRGLELLVTMKKEEFSACTKSCLFAAVLKLYNLFSTENRSLSKCRGRTCLSECL